MNYDWNMNEIKRDKFLYEYITNNMDDDYTNKESAYSQLLREFYMLDRYSFLRCVCGDIADRILDKSLKIDFVMEDYIPLSIDDALALTNDFYTDVLKNSPALLKIFTKEFSNRFNQIKLEKYSNQINLGFAMYSKKLHKSYIKINVFDDFMDLITAIHEYGHVLSASLCNRNMSCNPFIEFESVFMEFLAINYFKKYNEFKEECNCYKNNSVADYLFGMNALHNRFCFNDALKYHQYNNQTYDFDKRQILNIIEYYTGCEKNEIKKQLKYNVEANMPYLVADSYAFDFVNLYRNDPEKAMYIYQNMISFTGKNSESASYMNKKVRMLGLTNKESYNKF